MHLQQSWNDHNKFPFLLSTQIPHFTVHLINGLQVHRIYSTWLQTNFAADSHCSTHFNDQRIYSTEMCVIGFTPRFLLSKLSCLSTLNCLVFNFHSKCGLFFVTQFIIHFWERFYSHHPTELIRLATTQLSSRFSWPQSCVHLFLPRSLFFFPCRQWDLTFDNILGGLFAVSVAHNGVTEAARRPRSRLS